MADWIDPDEEDDDYFSEALEGAELTGLEPKFVKIGSMDPKVISINDMGVDDLISTYIYARNQLATDRKGYKAREAAVKLHLSMISMILRDKADSIGGVDSFKTEVGTAYRNRKETFRVGAWTDLAAYVLKTGNIHILQKRVSPNAIKEIREATGEIPPGVEPHVEEEFAVRSPTARASKKSGAP